MKQEVKLKLEIAMQKRLSAGERKAKIRKHSALLKKSLKRNA